MAARPYLIDDRLHVPRRFNFARDVVDAHAEDPGKTAMIRVGEEGTDRRCLTFLDIKELSCRLANMLSDQGVTKGDRVFLMLGKRPEWWVTMVALHRLGAVGVPATTMLTAKDIAYRLGRCEIKAVITDREGEQKFEEVCGRGCGPALRLTVDTPEHDHWQAFSRLGSYSKRGTFGLCTQESGEVRLKPGSALPRNSASMIA